MVSDRPNVPVTAGNRSFIHALCRLLASKGHEVHFLFVVEPAQRKSGDVEAMRAWWGERLHCHYVPAWAKLLRSLKVRWRWWFCHGHYHCDDYYPRGLHRQVNALHREYGFGACLVNYYYLSRLFTLTAIPRKGMITHDCFAYKDLLVGGRHVYLNTTAHQEAIAMQRSPHVFALNEEEAAYFKRLSPRSSVHNVYSYYEYHAQPVRGNHDILFLSGGNVFNREGIRWFLAEVFPLVVERCKDARLLVGGSICNVLREMQLPDAVVLQGYVDNAVDFYSQGDVAINPISNGTGLKIKTFEAISYDKVTVVHPHSVVGIYKPSEAPLFVSASPEEWADFIVGVWAAPERMAAVKRRNKEYIEAMDEEIWRQYDNFLQ